MASNPYLTYGSDQAIDVGGTYDYLQMKRLAPEWSDFTNYDFEYSADANLSDYWQDPDVWGHVDFRDRQGTQRAAGEGWMLSDIMGDTTTYGYQGINAPIMGALNQTLGDLTFDEEMLENLVQEQMADRFWMQQGLLGVHEGGGVDQARLHDFSIDLGDAGALAMTNIFDPESIATTLSTAWDQDIGAKDVVALTPEMLEKTGSSYYDPVVETERLSLTDKLIKDVGGVGTGGFAGSGARKAGLSGAERQYGAGYQKILESILKAQGKAQGDVMDLIYGWGELETA